MSHWWKLGFSNRNSATDPPGNGPGGTQKSILKRRSRFWKTVTFNRVVRVETQDEGLSATQDHQTLAFVTNGKKAKWLLFRCPCGCGDLLRINLSPSIHPCWRLRVSRNGKLSIFPSIDRESGCGAHFFLTANVARLL
jgi:hypothetical protein